MVRQSSQMQRQEVGRAEEKTHQSEMNPMEAERKEHYNVFFYFQSYKIPLAK